MNLSVIYDRAFFEMHVPWHAEYDAIAVLLAQNLRFSSVLDMGCGNGFIIAKLAELGKDVAGVDGSAHALDFVPSELLSKVRTLDLTIPMRLGRYDLVVCSEVAEHLPEEHAETLINNLCGNSSGLVFFTAATPGQGGHYHLNEQPHDYWIAIFANRKFLLDRHATWAIRRGLCSIVRTTWWFAKNAMIFRG